MEDLKISVIVPVYNVEKYLHKCLNSLLNQTYRNLEIILVDNKSTDASAQICAEYAKKDNRFNVIYHKVNQGQSVSRNDGIDAATGEMIMFVDSDDWLEIGFIEDMVHSLPDKNTDILFAGGLIMEYTDHSEMRYAFNNEIYDYDNSHRSFFISKTLAPFIGLKRDKKSCATIAAIWNKLFKTSFLTANQLRFNTNLSPNEDVLFVLNALDKANSVAACKSVGYHYLQSQGSSLHRFNPDWPVLAEYFLNAIDKEFSSRVDLESLDNALEIRTMICINQVLHGYFFHKDNKLPYSRIKRELKAFKNIPLVKKTIHSNNSKYFLRRWLAFKFALRLPFITPIKILTEIF